MQSFSNHCHETRGQYKILVRIQEFACIFFSLRWTMRLFGVLLLSFGAFCAASAAECVAETAKCSEYWEKLLPHKNLISSEAELNSWCSKQVLFYECLEGVLLEDKNGNLSRLPTNLLISKLYSQDLCSDGSKSRIRLLGNAECINQLNTDFCILPEYLDIVTPDDDIPSTRCSQAEKTFSCIAATLVLNCGFDAGKVYRTMMKITRYSDEVCGIETSEGIPPCEGSKPKSADKNKNLADIYYGLFHRIGDVLDPEEDKNEFEEPIPDEIGEVYSEETIANLDSVDEVVTEAIKRAIDNLEENAILEELDIPKHVNSLPDSQSFPCSEDNKESKPYMKNPLITEVFKEFLFYNYSGLEYAMYWRQPLFSITQDIECNHLLPSYMKRQIFRCRLDYRYSDPHCVSNSTVHEKITPEFIRSFDPEVPCDSTIEFGPLPEWMSDLVKMRDEKSIREQTVTSTTQSSLATESPEVFATSSTLLHLATAVYAENETSTKWYEYDMKANNMNAPVPNEIFYEMREFVSPDLESFDPDWDKIKIGDSFFMLMYDPEFAKPIENVTCSRMDECHPRGRGVWKCKVWPRLIETCDTCGKYPTDDLSIGTETYARPATTRDSNFTKLDATEPTMTIDEFGVLQSSTPLIEPIALVFSGDDKSEQKIPVDNLENEAEMIDQLGSFMNDEPDSEMEETEKVAYNLMSQSDIDEIRLQILNSVLNDAESSDSIYKLEADTEDGDSEVIIATEDGLIDGNILIIKNVSDLDEAKYTLVSVPIAHAV